MESKLRRLVLIDYREDAVRELVDLVLEDDQCVPEPVHLALAADLYLLVLLEVVRAIAGIPTEPPLHLLVEDGDLAHLRDELRLEGLHLLVEGLEVLFELVDVQGLHLLVHVGDHQVLDLVVLQVLEARFDVLELRHQSLHHDIHHPKLLRLLVDCRLECGVNLHNHLLLG